MEPVTTTFWAPLGDTGRLVRQASSLQQRQNGALVAIASSRLPCSIEHWDSARRLAGWFRAVRCQLLAIRSRCQSLLVMDGATGASFLQTAATELGVPVARGRVVSNWQTWRRPTDTLSQFQILISPTLQAAACTKRDDPCKPVTAKTSKSSLPIRDEALWILADRLAILHLRHGGSWTQQLRTYRPSNTRWQPSLVEYHQTLAPPKNRPLDIQGWPDAFVSHRQLGPRRCVAASPTAHAAASRANQTSHRPRRPLVSRRPIWERGPVLTHWTRSRSGPWPGEAFAAYCLKLLYGWMEDRSAIASLSLIIQSGMIQASSQKIRSGDPVVCFGATPPNQTDPIYRRHLRQFDSTGFGIVVDRCWLARLGARPVVYGDDSTWRQLPARLRPYFQMAGRNNQWRKEREWRLLGNLSLDQLPSEAIEIVAPSHADTTQLEQRSPWPVRQIKKSGTTP